jgi:predicted transcriptional regulator
MGGGAFFWRFIVLMSPEVAAQAAALHNDGRRIRYIANLLGIPRRTVSDAIPQN